MCHSQLTFLSQLINLQRFFRRATGGYLKNEGWNVAAYSGTNDTDQVWHFSRQSDGSFIITSMLDGARLMLYNNEANNCTSIIVSHDSVSNYQKWYIYFTNRGYVFRPVYCNKVMDIANGRYDSGTNIQIYEFNSTYAQYYGIEKCNFSCVVNFNFNGGNCSISNKNIIYNSKYGELPEPTREGYKFDGWYTEKEGGTKITSDTIVTVTFNQTLYAHWTLIPVTTTTTTIKPPTTTTTTTTTTKTTPTTTTTTTTTTKPTTTAKSTTITTTTTEYREPYIIPDELIIEVGDSEELYLFNCTNQDDVKWVSVDKSIAKIENGKVTGISCGTVTIYAIANGTYCECVVTVKNKNVSPTISGDANDDGKVAIADAVAVSAFVANAEKNPMSEQGIANADVHNTGNGLNASDALVIQQFTTGIIENL